MSILKYDDVDHFEYRIFTRALSACVFFTTPAEVPEDMAPPQARSTIL